MKIYIPDNVKIILERLKNAGFEAYCVGGAVRDSIMGLAPGDWDVTTSALPEETRELFKDFKTVDTGLKHGTLTVIIDKTPYEVTTFRIDGEYGDNRHPQNDKLRAQSDERTKTHLFVCIHTHHYINMNTTTPSQERRPCALNFL